MERIFFQKLRSPVGELFIYADKDDLLALTFRQNKIQVLKQLGIERPVNQSNPLIQLTISQLEKYFKGELKSFQIPVRLSGTKFQLAIWNALRKIPHGEISNYKKQAIRLKKPQAVRAVGAANGRNPISIIIPCHRILGSNGSLTGYAGGISAKAKLLELEGQPTFSQ